jgi:hypothetical protein
LCLNLAVLTTQPLIDFSPPRSSTHPRQLTEIHRQHRTSHDDQANRRTTQGARDTEAQGSRRLCVERHGSAGTSMPPRLTTRRPWTCVPNDTWAKGSDTSVWDLNATASKDPKVEGTHRQSVKRHDGKGNSTPICRTTRRRREPKANMTM